MDNFDNAVNAIKAEREYQEEKGGGWNHGGVPSLEAELLMIDVYITEAKASWRANTDDNITLDTIRKIAAIATRCMENHGVVERNTQ